MDVCFPRRRVRILLILEFYFISARCDICKYSLREPCSSYLGWLILESIFGL